MNTVESIKHLFLQTGASWVLWLLAVLSVASLAIAIERWLHFQRNAGGLRALAEALHDLLSKRDLNGAIAHLEKIQSVAARVALSGLKMSHMGAPAVEKAMQSRSALEKEGLERRLVFLGTLGNNAPFVGLFGTVIGIIQAFEELGHGAPGHGQSGASAAGQVATQAVMSAIAEALVATAVGIAVALPAVAAYNFLQRRLSTLLSGAEVLNGLVMAYLLDQNQEQDDKPTKTNKGA